MDCRMRTSEKWTAKRVNRMRPSGKWIAFKLDSQAISAEILNVKNMSESHEASSKNDFSDSRGKVIE